MAYSGGCHCGAVQFTVHADAPQQAVSCNCSHCRAQGLLLTFVPAEQFVLDKGEDALRTYMFNTRKIEHRFCTICGAEPFSAGLKPDGSAIRAVNLRCVPQIDLASLTITEFDGAKI